MATRTRLTGPARRWLAAEVRYLAERSPAAASDLLDSIEEARLRLADYPELGPASRVRGMRRLILGQYILTYCRSADAIEIISIRHGRQTDPADPARTPSPATEEC